MGQAATVFRTTVPLLLKLLETEEMYPVEEDQHLVQTSDGRWRVPNILPATWLVLTPADVATLEDTGINTIDEILVFKTD